MAGEESGSARVKVVLLLVFSNGGWWVGDRGWWGSMDMMMVDGGCREGTGGNSRKDGSLPGDRFSALIPIDAAMIRDRVDRLISRMIDRIQEDSGH